MFVLSTSVSFSKEFIGVIGAAIGEIKNQNQEILITGSKVFYGDTILTSKASNAQILFLDQTVLTLGEDTELTIDDFIYNSETHDGNFVTEVKSGTVKFITGQISKLNPDNLEVKLPEGTLGARGTEFVVLSEKNKNFRQFSTKARHKLTFRACIDESFFQKNFSNTIYSSHQI